MDSIKKILEYTNIINSYYIPNEKKLYLKCEHTFEPELINSNPYIEYEYICSKCRYATKHIV